MITTEHPLRHPLQAIVSLGQLYGDVLYYATSMFDHYYFKKSYWRPEAYYYWCYYVFLNLFWIVIPLSEFLRILRYTGRNADKAQYCCTTAQPPVGVRSRPSRRWIGRCRLMALPRRLCELHLAAAAGAVATPQMREGRAVPVTCHCKFSRARRRFGTKCRVEA